MSRVVVTGLGLITALGNDLNSSWDALCAGKSGVTEIEGYDTSQFRVHFGAQVRNFDPSLYMDRKEIRRNDPYEHIAIATTKQVLAQLVCTLAVASGAL
jgi:3-oxoacyl-[acyl-carrier-protein] synthase II